MRVWVDGNRLPIGVFKRAERQSGQAVLVGIGGTELETRVEHEVDQQATHELVEELVSANTDLTPNVDAPESTLQEGVEMLAVDTTSEILGAIEEIDETTPATVENDSIKLYQTAWTTEAEDATADSSTIFDPSTHDPDGEFSGGDGLRLNDSSHDAEYEFTTNHTIPEGTSVSTFGSTSPRRMSRSRGGRSRTRVGLSSPRRTKTGWESPASDGMMCRSTATGTRRS